MRNILFISNSCSSRTCSERGRSDWADLKKVASFDLPGPGGKAF